MEVIDEDLREIPARVAENVDAVNSNDHFELQHLQRRGHVVADTLAVLSIQLGSAQPFGQGSTVMSSIHSLWQIGSNLY